MKIFPVLLISFVLVLLTACVSRYPIKNHTNCEKMIDLNSIPNFTKEDKNRLDRLDEYYKKDLEILEQNREINEKKMQKYEQENILSQNKKQ